MDADLTVSETKNIYSPMKGDPTQGIVDIQEQTSMEEDYLNFGLDSPPSALVNLNLASASSAAGSAFEPSLHQQQTTIENSEFENMDYLNLPNNDSMVIGNTIGRENDYFDPENALHTAGKEDVVSVDCKVSAHTRTIMSGLFEVEKVGSIAPEINSMENGKLEINHEQGSFIEQINPVGNQMDHQDCPSETNHPDQIFIDSKEEKSYENNHGPRVTHFRSALRKMLQATIKSCSRSERIDECFPFGMSSDQLVQLEAVLSSELTALGPEIQISVEQLLVENDLVNKLDAVDTFLRSVDGKSTLVADMKPPMQAVESAIAPSKLEAIRKLQLSVSDMESQNLSLQSIIEAQKDDLIRRCRRATDKQLLFDTVFDQILSTAKTAELETLVDRMINL